MVTFWLLSTWNLYLESSVILTFDAILPRRRLFPDVVQPAGRLLTHEVEVLLELHPPLARVFHAGTQFNRKLLT